MPLSSSSNATNAGIPASIRSTLLSTSSTVIVIQALNTSTYIPTGTPSQGQSGSRTTQHNLTITSPPATANRTTALTGELYTYGNTTFATLCSVGDLECNSVCFSAVSSCSRDWEAYMTAFTLGSTIMTTTVEQQPIISYGTTSLSISTYETTRTGTSYEDVTVVTSGDTTYTSMIYTTLSTSTITTTDTMTTTYIFVGGEATTITPYGTWTVTKPILANGTVTPSCRLNDTDVCTLRRNCGPCTIHGGSVQLMYWPVANATNTR